MKKVLFIFRGEIQEKILRQAPEYKNIPTEFLYGMPYVDTSKFEVNYANTLKTKKNLFKGRFWNLLEKIFFKITKLGFTFDIRQILKKELAENDIYICINEHAAFGVLFWKKLGFIKGDAIILLQRLPESIKFFRWCRPMIGFIKVLLKEAKLVWTLSDQAQKVLIDEFNVPGDKIKTIYFGTDSRFWHPDPEVREEDYIMSIGNDHNRDYPTLVKALPKNIKLKIVTRKPVDAKGKQLETITGISDERLREIYQKALFVVVPSVKCDNESSGLSSTLQAMACAKPIIVSDALALRELFSHQKHCLFYKSENVDDLNEKTRFLLNNPETRKKLGQNARQKIDDDLSTQMTGRKIEQCLVDLYKP